MKRKRVIQIVVIAVALCVATSVAVRTVMLRQAEQRLEEARSQQLQKQTEEAERMERIQNDFEEMIEFAHEYQESIEKLSIASVEQMMQVMNINDFDYQQACEVANIGDDAEKLEEEFYLDVSAIKYSIEWQSEYPEMSPEVAYIYRKGNSAEVEMFLIYFYTDTPEETWEYYGSGSEFDGYEQITEHLYAVWSIPRYT